MRSAADALALDLAHRVHLPGALADPALALGLFDLFVHGADAEPAPALVAAAMASGLAVIAPETGDLAEMLGPENRALLPAPGSDAGLVAALLSLARDRPAQQLLGTGNRLRAAGEYDAKMAIAAYRSVCADALGRAAFP